MSLLRNTGTWFTLFILIICCVYPVHGNNHEGKNNATSPTPPLEQPMTELEYCYDGAMFESLCEVPDDMKDLGFWDINAVMFSDTILDALVYGCTMGTWCLQDRFDFWDAQIVERADMVMNSEIAASMCKPKMTPCFDKIAEHYRNCSQANQLRFSIEAIRMMCHLRENADVSQTCIKQTLVSLHVTVADVMRNERFISAADNTELSCEGADISMTKGLICMENSCPGEQAVFREFEPWLWFTESVDDLIAYCDLDPSICFNVLQPFVEEEVYFKELGAVVGGSLAAVVILMTAIACLLYRRHRRNAVVKEGYQKLLNDGDQS